MTIHLLHPDGTVVPLLGMRNTRTGELRPATAAELAALVVQIGMAESARRTT